MAFVWSTVSTDLFSVSVSPSFDLVSIRSIGPGNFEGLWE